MLLVDVAQLAAWEFRGKVEIHPSERVEEGLLHSLHRNIFLKRDPQIQVTWPKDVLVGSEAWCSCPF